MSGKGRKKNLENRTVFVYLWYWLRNGLFNEVFAWTNKDALEFSVSFMNIRNPKWSPIYIKPFKELDYTSQKKSAKYEKSKNHDKDCKKRFHSNLQKLCKDGILEFIEKKKIGAFEVYYYKFLKTLSKHFDVNRVGVNVIDIKSRSILLNHPRLDVLLDTQSVQELHTQSVQESHTQSVQESHTQSVQESHTQSVQESHTQSVQESHTQSVDESHTQTGALLFVIEKVVPPTPVNVISSVYYRVVSSSLISPGDLFCIGNKDLQYHIPSKYNIISEIDTKEDCSFKEKSLKEYVYAPSERSDNLDSIDYCYSSANPDFGNDFSFYSDESFYSPSKRSANMDSVDYCYSSPNPNFGNDCSFGSDGKVNPLDLNIGDFIKNESLDQISDSINSEKFEEDDPFWEMFSIPEINSEKGMDIPFQSSSDFANNANLLDIEENMDLN